MKYEESLSIILKNNEEIEILDIMKFTKFK